MIIHKSQPTEQARLITGSQVTEGGDLNQMGANVAPVYEISPKFSTIVWSNHSTSSGASITLGTTLADRDFYITSLSYSFIKDAACDVASSGSQGVWATINGATTYLVRTPKLTLTAQSLFITQSFPHPIKVDKGTSIVASQGTFTAGNMITSASITGFYI